MHHLITDPNVQTNRPLTNRSVNLRIHFEYRKLRTRKKSVFTHFSRSGSFVFCGKFSVREDFFHEFALFSGRFFPNRKFCVRNFLLRKNEKLHLCVVTATIVWVYYNCPLAWGELFFNLLQYPGEIIHYFKDYSHTFNSNNIAKLRNHQVVC